MTGLLEKAFAEAARLPEEEQNALASWILIAFQALGCRCYIIFGG